MQGRARTLDTKTEFLIFLCRISQGFREQHFATLLGVSISTVCGIILTWSNVIYLRLGSQNILAERVTIDTHMPESIKSKYPSTRAIIDCTEIKVQTPSSLVLVSEFFPHYKNDITPKAPVGCTPSGRPTDRPTDRLIDRSIDRSIDRPTDRSIDRSIV